MNTRGRPPLVKRRRRGYELWLGAFRKRKRKIWGLRL